MRFASPINCVSFLTFTTGDIYSQLISPKRLYETFTRIQEAATKKCANFKHYKQIRGCMQLQTWTLIKTPEEFSSHRDKFRA
jgi:hypothetical protein